MSRAGLSLVVLVVSVLAVTTVAAAEGDAQFGLGKATWRAGNPERAREFFEQAAAKGHLEAMHVLGLMHLESKIAGADVSKAAEWFRRAAENGHPESMNHYGNLFRSGKGVAKSDADALVWHRKAAEAGSVHAMANLAEALRHGIGTSARPAEAAEWYRKLAEDGNAEAMLNYGYMLSNGDGIAQDVAQALEWYRKSARGGHSSAMYNLGEYYRAGKGVAKNETAARFWFLRAAMKGDGDAEKAFVALAAASPDTVEGDALYREANATRAKASTNAEFAAAKLKAFPLYLQAAELGHRFSIGEVLLAYQHGDGTAKDLVKAREWAHIAAEMGSDGAATILGQLLLQGIGGERNTQGARFWFEKAALAGNSLAMQLLARIYDGEFGLPPNEALATYWWLEAHRKGSPTAELELKRRGLLEPDPQAQAFIDRINADGPDLSSVQQFTYDVAVYCKFGGPRCHEFSVAARKFERDHNAGVVSANMARLWNVYSQKDPDADRKWRERSDCMNKKTQSIQRHTYGQQDWYYTGSCY